MDFVKHTSAKRQQHSSDSFRMTSQIEREWEKTLRTTFGVTGSGLGDDDDDEVDKQKQQNQQQQPAEVQQKARQVLGVIDERRSSGSTRVDGPSIDGGSGLMVPGGVVLGLRERRGSSEGPGRSL